ncbi:MAG: hypothetical protein U1A27_01865 [Phycisphaerae bacterium]
MKIYAPFTDFSQNPATLCVVGTDYYPPELPRGCPSCKRSNRRTGPPIVAEFHGRSKHLTDVLGFGWTAISERVRDALLPRFTGFEAWPVTFQEAAKRKRPPPKTSRRVRRAPFPPPDAQYYWFEVTAGVPLYRERSTVELGEPCPVCGRCSARILGREEYDHDVDPFVTPPITRRTPRQPGKGVFVRREDLGGHSVFFVEEFPGFILFTEPLRDFWLEQGFTGELLLEYGDVV